MAIAYIGRTVDTIEDRSITIKLRRKLANEHVEKLPIDLKEQSKDIRRKCLRWYNDNVERLKAARVQVPTLSNNRAMDNWEPLITIADVIDTDLGVEARKAMLTLENNKDDDTDVSLAILAIISDLFKERGTDRLTTEEILAKLKSDDTYPWADWDNGKGITARVLANKLQQYGIKPKNMRFECSDAFDSNIIIKGTRKGYELKMFEDVFNRYLCKTEGGIDEE